MFDKDKDGFLTVRELRKIMTAMGDRMPRQEFDAMVKEVDTDNDGLINCQGNIKYKGTCLIIFVKSFALFSALKSLERQKRGRSHKRGREGS